MTTDPVPATADLLAFLTGHWPGQGFVLDFTAPRGGMVFGSLQVLEQTQPRQATVYWEQFHFYEAAGSLVLHPLQRGRSLGEFRLVEADARRVVFESASNRKERRLYFATQEPGRHLVAGVEGVKDGRPYTPSWEMKRGQSED